ncbi:MAG: hypothetical protein K0R93_1431 [Anaerosolibacter sp.]|uniref:putative nucleotide-diphospho-sugar transferase n=1 Tax=Anaerosolibacter sp. TaxID=1872527 RepID=UPI0026212175|nr:putative nucleotide-diphospho-sugar transferase [Anaerosolibacter sp.]MDF2546533.1 hypothetical protein [Anaerosolibacter sp.]
MKDIFNSLTAQLKNRNIKDAYCIIVSKYRLYQVIALCRSIEKYVNGHTTSEIFILCMDTETYDILKKIKLTQVTLLQLYDIETNELRLIKKQRRLNEYCWTLKPVLLDFILDRFPSIHRVTHLDVDLYFFNDPRPIFENQGKCSVLLSDHDYPDDVKEHSERMVGKVNSGFVSFIRNENGIACLKWWKIRCIEWCYDRIEPNRFSDQKYLEEAPHLFEGICYIKTHGVNIAPWNEKKYTVSLRNNEICVNNDRLIMYHFGGFRLRNKNEYSLALDGHNEPIALIYEPYTQALREAISDVEKVDSRFNAYLVEEKYKKNDRIFKFNGKTVLQQEGDCFYATIVSDRYICKAITMYKSLARHSKSFHLFMLCTDEVAYKMINSMNLKKVTCIMLDEVEDRDLLSIKSRRTKTEYSWTLKPALLHYIMTHYSTAQYYAMIDSDLFFFADPIKIFNEAPQASLYLTDHYNSKRFQHYYNKSGKINSGFVGCKNNETALAAVEWWKSRCIAWCFNRFDQVKKLYGDQRHLETWPKLFSNVHIVRSKGAHVAPWNIEGYQLSERDGKLYVNDQRIVLYHFSGFGIYSPREFSLSWFNRVEDQVVNSIYLPYIKTLTKVIEEVKELYPDFEAGFVKRGDYPEQHYYKT